MRKGVWLLIVVLIAVLAFPGLSAAGSKKAGKNKGWRSRPVTPPSARGRPPIGVPPGPPDGVPPGPPPFPISPYMPHGWK